jgi:hypothetical protein
VTPTASLAPAPGRAPPGALDLDAPGFARALRAGLVRAAAYAPPQALVALEEACRECEDALLYWHERAETAPLDAVLEHLATEEGLEMRELHGAMRRARDFARETYPGWRWPARVIGALLLAHLVGSLLRRCASIRRMDDDDPLTQTYRKLIENRPAWMPA